MKSLIYTLRYLVKNSGTNLIRIISITLGLVVGIVLLSQVAFETSFDRFYPDKDRIYQILTHYSYQQDERVSSGQVYPLLPAVRDEITGVVTGTMYCGVGASPFYYNDQPYIFPNMLLADSLFFDFFNVKLLQGDLKTGFAKNDNIFISKSFAQKIFKEQDPVGQTILYNKSEPCTVVGVFEDFPQNSKIAFDAVMPLSNVFKRGYYISWNGGGRYACYVKLSDGADPATIAENIKALYAKHTGYADKQDDRTDFILYPITQIHLDDPDIEHQLYIKSLLAFIILLVGAMNYILASISSLSSRARTMAMHKCNGCTTRGIFRMMISETGILLCISMALTVLLIFAFRQPIQQIIVTPFIALFTFANLSKALIVVLVLFLLAGIVPARIYAAIPVALAFRSYTLNKRTWKQMLLFVQFAGVTLLVALLLIVIRQYQALLDKDLGFEYKDLVYVPLTGNTPGQTTLIKQQLGQMPEIESVSFCSDFPFWQLPGEMVYDDSTHLSLFNSRWSEIDPALIPTLNMQIKCGKNFNEVSTSGQIIVNEEFLRQKGVHGNPIGQTIIGTGIIHTPHTIVGVVEDFYVNPLNSSNALYPIIFLPATPSENLVMKFNGISPEKLSKVEQKLRELLPKIDISLQVYRETIRSQYVEEVRLRNTVILGVIVTLLIALIGLIGYTKDEITRSSKEIAVRKVNGATAGDIIRLVTMDLRWTVVSALITGLAGAVWLGQNWLKQFAVKTPLSAWIFLISAIMVGLIITATITVRTWRVANENPVRSIKKE